MKCHKILVLFSIGYTAIASYIYIYDALQISGLARALRKSLALQEIERRFTNTFDG